jgi:exodeoxyribonuclease VII small subunit
MEQEKLTFEEALGRLEKIVSQIETGKVSLDQSIEKYAEGVALIKQCRSILESAEKKIQLLAKDQGMALEVSGELEDAPEP